MGVVWILGFLLELCCQYHFGCKASFITGWRPAVDYWLFRWYFSMFIPPAHATGWVGVLGDFEPAGIFSLCWSTGRFIRNTLVSDKGFIVNKFPIWISAKIVPAWWLIAPFPGFEYFCVVVRSSVCVGLRKHTLLCATPGVAMGWFTESSLQPHR